MVIHTQAGRELRLMQWGLVPSWSKEGKAEFSTINARAETVDTKPTYRTAFRQRRCLVPSDGFYEWRQGQGKAKQPFRIGLADGGLFAMAGLWERWQPRDGQAGEPLDSFSIIVGSPNELVRPIHDRMPVILPPEVWDAWLDPATPDPKSLLTTLPAAAMRAYPVSTKVNSPRNNSPDVLEPISQPTLL